MRWWRRRSYEDHIYHHHGSCMLIWDCEMQPRMICRKKQCFYFLMRCVDRQFVLGYVSISYSHVGSMMVLEDIWSRMSSTSYCKLNWSIFQVPEHCKFFSPLYISSWYLRIINIVNVFYSWKIFKCKYSKICCLFSLPKLFLSWSAKHVMSIVSWRTLWEFLNKKYLK